MPPGQALATFKARTRYGPVFGCLFCQGAFFLEEVVEVTKVPALATAGAQARYLDREFILRHLPLFTMLDTQWVSLTCESSIIAGRLPTMAAVNGLPAA